MIQSTSSSDRTGGTDAISLSLGAAAKAQPTPIDQDRVTTQNLDSLQSALASQPEVRPEVVARGQALAADPDYPSADIINHIAGLIANSPDLSEDPS